MDSVLESLRQIQKELQAIKQQQIDFQRLLNEQQTSRCSCCCHTDPQRNTRHAVPPQATVADEKFDVRYLQEEAAPDGQQGSEKKDATLDEGGTEMPPGHPAVDPRVASGGRCPFSTLGNRPLSPPSPPTSHGLNDKTVPDRPLDHKPVTNPQMVARSSISAPQTSLTRQQEGDFDPSPSVEEQAEAQQAPAQCPIRLLPSHGPEEIAAYFSEHKHEIPRSHEICVRRYGQDAASVRKLDEKYGGDMVGVIQGLGVKHWNYLRQSGAFAGGDEDQEEIRSDCADRGAMEESGRDEGVKKWVENIDEEKEEIAPPPTSHIQQDQKDDNDPTRKIEAEGDLQRSTKRPLRDIRLGESPSRPWGIRVPSSAARSRSRSRSKSRSGERGKARNASEVSLEEGDRGRSAAWTPDLKQKQRGQYIRLDDAIETTKDQRMLFTGPVFIGYGADEAAKIFHGKSLLQGT